MTVSNAIVDTCKLNFSHSQKTNAHPKLAINFKIGRIGREVHVGNGMGGRLAVGQSLQALRCCIHIDHRLLVPRRQQATVRRKSALAPKPKLYSPAALAAMTIHRHTCKAG